MKFLWSALVSVSLLSLSACSTTRDVASVAGGSATTHKSETLLPVAKHSAHKHEKHSPASGSHSKRSVVSADQALGWLINGNLRYRNNKLRNDGQSAADRARLSSKQTPHTIVLSCSDSRVPPEVLFDQKLGEIFVIRTAGESLDHSSLASIEYAVEHLAANLILVMGHESCGAVKAALSTLNGGDAGSPALNHLVKDLQPHLRSFASVPVSEGAVVEGWANTEGVAKDLVDRSQIVRDAVNGGKVKIQTGLYHLSSGVVEFR